MGGDGEWANVLLSGTTAIGARHVIDAVNRSVGPGRANMADVIDACAQILGQGIAGAGPQIAAEVRAGILKLIDDYASHAAMTKEPK